jgi:hypothetical protein
MVLHGAPVAGMGERGIGFVAALAGDAISMLATNVVTNIPALWRPNDAMRFLFNFFSRQKEACLKGPRGQPAAL